MTNLITISGRGGVKNSIKIKEFVRDLVYDQKYIKTKTKSYNRKINTNFDNHKI